MVYNGFRIMARDHIPVSWRGGAAMATQTHGGDIWRYGSAPLLDFSASLNPLGMAPEVEEAALRGLRACVHYPDPKCSALTEALTSALGVPASWVLWGNGAAALLNTVAAALRPRRALVFDPCFGEYRRALDAVDCTVISSRLLPEENFDLTLRHLDDLTPDLDLVALCNPNNPTGRCISSEVLLEVLERCAQRRVPVLVDESFFTLSDPECRTDLILLLERFPLLLLRSLTKDHCIPGLRLGYLLCADPALRQKLAAWEQPWAVSVPAQFAGTAALTRPDWPERARNVFVPQRERLMLALRKLGLQAWESHANFLLFRAPGRGNLVEKMLNQGILIRSCASFYGLGEDYYRIVVRGEEENTALLAALTRTLEED